jgi:HD-GYP domain-containing protein (c-di-GMP phosphodiesterase class II)
VLCLADYIAIITGDGVDIFAKRNEIIDSVKEKSGSKYDPLIVEGFLSLSEKEYFWLDLISDNLGSIISNTSFHDPLELDLSRLLELGKVFSHIIDFRSRFTATHTSGVAASARALAGVMGFSERQCRSMEFAGLIHDLGKLAVPNEILEKPAKLNVQEFNIIKSHTYHTYRVLESLPNFETLACWGAFHHERLNGKGYPFRHFKDDLSLGARIMAVADVFTALTEDRPYRDGMDKDKTLNTIKKMADSGALDPYVVKGLEQNYTELNQIRKQAQETAYQAFLKFEKSCFDLGEVGP